MPNGPNGGSLLHMVGYENERLHLAHLLMLIIGLRQGVPCCDNNANSRRVYPGIGTADD